MDNHYVFVSFLGMDKQMLYIMHISRCVVISSSFPKCMSKTCRQHDDHETEKHHFFWIISLEFLFWLTSATIQKHQHIFILDIKYAHKNPMYNVVTTVSSNHFCYGIVSFYIFLFCR